MKNNGWWLDKVGLRKWYLKYKNMSTIFEMFNCGITAIQVRAMLNRHDMKPNRNNVSICIDCEMVVDLNNGIIQNHKCVMNA